MIKGNNDVTLKREVNRMTVNRVTMDKLELIFCNKCYREDKNSHMPMKRERWQYTWERYPDKDIKYDNGKVAEYAYRCRNCGDIAYYPYEPNLK